MPAHEGGIWNTLLWWGLIVVATIPFVLGDTLSKIWAEGGPWAWPAFAAIVVIAPIGYMLFGWMAKRSGLALASGLINSLLVLGTMLVGLVIMREWNKVTPPQYVGMALAFAGIILMLLFEQPKQ